MNIAYLYLKRMITGKAWSRRNMGGMEPPSKATHLGMSVSSCHDRASDRLDFNLIRRASEPVYNLS